jgi:hypothetical protein
MDVAAINPVDRQAGCDSAERWRLVCVSATEPRWTSLALQLAEANLPHPRIEWVDSAALLVQCLRHDHYDAIVIDCSIDAQQLVAGLRAGGHADAVVVLISSPADELLASLAEHDAEALVSLSPWDSPALLPTIQRAIRLASLRRGHRELQLKHERRLCRDRDEATAMLHRQQQLLANLVREPDAALPASIRDGYVDFLQTQLTGDTSPAESELAPLAAALIAADVPPQQLLALHAAAVQRLAAGLDESAARHVHSRADRLALDLMVELAEGYRSGGA